MPTSSSAYRGKSIVNTHLKWDVFVTPSIPVVTTDFAPGEQERPWPPTSSTLIYGSRDAVVVDSFITLEQARAQADWIGSTGKNLTTIYATHGHGDHFFGASVLLERFPNALSLPKMLSGANVFEISDIERMNIGARQPGI
jgi:glyoxylase-like metal-dependent hydrolase (beta-lactamase superfamily II)